MPNNIKTAIICVGPNFFNNLIHVPWAIKIKLLLINTSLSNNLTASIIIEPFLKSFAFKEEYKECAVAIITQSAFLKTQLRSELNLTPNDSFE